MAQSRSQHGSQHHVVWYGMVWYGMVWYGMIWFGMVWYGMEWYGMEWSVCMAGRSDFHWTVLQPPRVQDCHGPRDTKQIDSGKKNTFENEKKSSFRTDMMISYNKEKL